MAKAYNNLVSNLFETLKAKKISVPKFSDATGIPKDRVYKWKYEGTSPKSEDEKIITGWLAQQKMENVPNENGITSNNALVRPQEAQQAPDYRDELISLLKEKLNSGQRQQLLMLQRNQALLNAIIQTLIEMEGKAGKKAAHAEMNKRIEHALDVVKKEGI